MVNLDSELKCNIDSDTVFLIVLGNYENDIFGKFFKEIKK